MGVTRTRVESRGEVEEWPWTWCSVQRPWLRRRARELTEAERDVNKGAERGRWALALAWDAGKARGVDTSEGADVDDDGATCRGK